MSNQHAAASSFTFWGLLKTEDAGEEHGELIYKPVKLLEIYEDMSVLYRLSDKK